MSRHQKKQPMEGKTIFFIVFLIVLFNVIVVFPFLIVLIVIAFLKFDLSLNKILKNFGVTDYMKKNFGGKYEKIIADMKKNLDHQERITKNQSKRSEVEDFFHEASKNQGDKKNGNLFYPSIESTIENNRQREEEKEEIRIKEKNKSVLIEKLSHKKVVKKYTKDIHKKSNILSNKHGNKLIGNTDDESHRFASEFARKSQNKSTNKNYFGNTKQTTSFGNGKSIWDNYESVTDKFSSNIK